MRNILVLALAAPLALPAQTTTIRTGTTEVLVDVVARDKRGRLLRGLTANDFKITEDGVPQPVTSFREIRGPEAPGTEIAAQVANETKPGESSLKVGRQIRLVSLVFERLGPDGRRFSRQAALNFLENDHGGNAYYSIFTVDRAFRVLQPYTNDKYLLKWAIEKATGGERAQFESDQAQISRIQEGNQGAPAPAMPSAANPAPDGAGFSAMQAARMAGEMASFANTVMVEDMSRTSIFSLWAIIQELDRLPGRKSILYFTEGAPLPNGAWQQFQGMIGAANRANVSIYPIDARGLLTASDIEVARAGLARAAASSWQTRNTETTGQQEFRTFDTALDSTSAHLQVNLNTLAVSTGGFLIANTNDFRPGLKRLSEDFNTYYELTYRSSNPSFDGRFRKIEVKVAEKDAVLQAREGYFALPPMEGQTVFPYEVPMLHTLSKSPFPRDLEYRAGVVRFSTREGVEFGELVFDLPLKDIAFKKDDRARAWHSHVSVLALVKDEQGQVVAKLSRDVPLSTPLDKIEGFKQGRFIVTRVVKLTPGRYTVESVVADHQGAKASARKSALVVLERAAGPALSGMTLVRRLDSPAPVPDPNDPYHLPKGRVIPMLADYAAGGKGAQVTAFVVGYPQKELAEKPVFLLDVRQDGRTVKRFAPEMPAPNERGEVPMILTVPVEGLAPGQYEFRAALAQGTVAATQSLFVTIE